LAYDRLRDHALELDLPEQPVILDRMGQHIFLS